MGVWERERERERERDRERELLYNNLNTKLSDKTQYIVHVFWLNYQNHEETCVGLENLDKWLIDWLMFNVQRAIFQLYSGREHLNILKPRDSKQGKVMGRDG